MAAPALAGCLLLGIAGAAAPPGSAAAAGGADGLDSVSLLQVSQRRQPPRPAYFWAGKNGDLSRTGASRSVATSNVSAGPSWSFDGGLVHASPLLDAEKNIYLATNPGMVYKMTPKGKIVWQRNTTQSIPGVPAIANGLLFTSFLDGTVVALDMATGAQRWSRKVGVCSSMDTFSMTATSSVVIVPVGRAPFCLRNVELVALGAQDGVERWRYRPDTGVYNLLAAVVEKSLVFSDGSGRAYRLNITDGREMWKFSDTSKLDFSTGGAVVGPNRVVYVTSNVGNFMSVQSSMGYGRLSAFSLDTGARLWYRDLELQANNAAAVGYLHPSGAGPLSVVVGIGENPNEPPQMRGYKPGKMVAFDAETGRRLDWGYSLPVWEHRAAAGDVAPEHVCLPDAFSNPAVGGDGSVYAGFEDGRLYALRDADGDGKISEGEVSTYDFGNAFQGSPAIAPGMLVVTPCNGMHVFLS